MVDHITGSELKKKLNPKMHSKIEDATKYEITWRTAAEFLRADRLDLAIKYEFARDLARDVDSEFPKSAYLAHIDSINGFFENDGTGKIGPASFVDAFKSLIQSLRKGGFDVGGVVPVNGSSILDGAHRVAGAAALGLRVPTIQLDVPPHVIDHEFFRINGMAREFMDYAVNSFVRINPDCRVILRWPNADGQEKVFDQEVLSSARIVCRERIELSPVGKINVVRIAYATEPWLGTVADGFQGAVNKSAWCFGERSSVEILVVTPHPGADMVAMKERIRGFYKVGKHALHVTDTYEEAKGLVELLFNENGRELLNSQRLISHPWFDRLSQDFSEFLRRFGFDANDFCFVGSAPLAVLGVRDVRDLDFVSIEDGIDFGLKEIDCHNGDFPLLGVSHLDVVTNPRYHFVVGGMKVLALRFLLDYKRQRGEQKDIEDIQSATLILQGKIPSVALRVVLAKRLSLRYWVRRVKLIALKIRYRLRMGWIG